jgi:hypothetical protein
VHVGVRIAPDGSKPSGFAIVTRAAENAYLGEQVFIVAAERFYTSNPIDVLNSLQKALARTCAKGTVHPAVIWINKDASNIFQIAAEKLNMYVTRFLDDDKAGLMEMNYYFQNVSVPSPFYSRNGTSRCLVVVNNDQFSDSDVRDEQGMLSLRQELASWSYNEHGETQHFGGVTLDCVRMTLCDFALSATALTPEEKIIAKLPPELQPAAVRAKLGTPEYIEAVLAQEYAMKQFRMQEEEHQSTEELWLGPRPCLRGIYRGR